MPHSNSKPGTQDSELFRLRSPFRASPWALRLRSFSLIELIAVLAVIALLASSLVPTLIRQMDRIAGDQESAALKSLGDALNQSIRRNRYIPSQTDWASTVATESGVAVSNVTTNGRKQPRFFLIDPAWQIGTSAAGQAYLQTGAGASGVTNARVMLVSSIGRMLPASITNGVASSSNFNALWDWNDASSALPATSFAWTGWPDTDDLKVRRVNLSSLFVRLLLGPNASTTKCFYSIDSTNAPDRVSTNGTDGYFLQDSILFLYNGSYNGRTNLNSQRILVRDNSFVYDQDVWRDSIGGRSGGASSVAGLDLGSIVDQYLRAPENTNALNYTYKTGTNQQWIVVSNMMVYLDAYSSWAETYSNQPAPWPHDTNYDAAVAAQGKMVEAVQYQYLKVGNTDCTPTPYSDARCQ